MEYCVSVFYHSWVQTSECNSDALIPSVINQSSGMPIPGVSEYPSTNEISVPIDLMGLGEGELMVLITIQDWAGNHFEKNWSIYVDATPPVVSWATFPSSGNGALESQFQDISWWSSEKVTLGIEVNGLEMPIQNGSSGSLSLILNTTGPQSLCIRAIDGTIEQENRNVFLECREFTLSESIYDTSVSSGKQDLVSLDSFEIALSRHWSQEIRWRSITTGASGFIEPGEGTVLLPLELEEGINEFVIEVDSLDSTDSYTITLERDSTPPILEFSEFEYRESPLTTSREISGICEPGLLVRISSPIQSRDVLCPDSGSFEVNISVPSDAGSYTISGTSIDEAKNSKIHEITVQKKDWVDWAIEDASENGPMLWWLSVVGLSVISVIVGTTLKFSRWRNKAHP